MSRIDRLKEYAKPRGPRGESTKANIEQWSARASDNSKIAPRADDGPMSLPPTGKAMAQRDTASKPFVSRKVDRLMAGKDDLNHVGGSGFMQSVRRKA